MNSPVHVVVLRRLESAPARVFDACLDPAALVRWLSGADPAEETLVRLALDARVGGRFTVVVRRGDAEIEHTGEYLALDRPRLLAFTWAAGGRPDDAGRVILELTPHGAGCDAKLTHVLGTGWSADVDATASAWARLLDVLERALAPGAAGQSFSPPIP